MASHEPAPPDLPAGVPVMGASVLTPAKTRFGQLVTQEAASGVETKIRCLCDCGTERSVLVSSLRSGNTASCGCSRSSAVAGPLNPSWKGDAAGYNAFHLRVVKLRGRPMHCTRCGTSDPALTYDWANLTGNYADPDDYERMCRSCHRWYDGARRLSERRRTVKALTARGLSSRQIGRLLGLTHRTILKDRRTAEGSP